MKIVFDLDGVMRLLQEYLYKKYKVPYPKDWWWTYKDKDIYDWAIYNNYKICKKSPASKYFNIIKKYYPEPEIWTHQPKDWQKYTLIWLDNHFDNYIIRFLNTEQKRKRLNKYKDTILIEDSPNFSNYERIILIDFPYNRNIKNVVRIRKISELEKILKKNKET
jgi:hypothetical protein